MGWDVLLDTVFELCVLLDCSPVAISRMYNCQLRVIYWAHCCQEHSNLQKEVVEGVQPHHPHSCCLQKGLGLGVGPEGLNFALIMLGMRQRAHCARGDGCCR